MQYDRSHHRGYRDPLLNVRHEECSRIRCLDKTPKVETIALTLPTRIRLLSMVQSRRMEVTQ